MTTKKYIITKAIANVISGLSMVIIITLGIMYMSFDNAFVFQDIKIEVVNNPIEQHDDIEFMMIGSKKFECNSTKVYGIAYSDDGYMHRLDKFTKQYFTSILRTNRVYFYIFFFYQKHSDSYWF